MKNPKHSKEYNLENLYQNYLRRVRLDPARMSQVQQTETKRAFFAGLSSMYVAAIVNVSKIERDDQANDVLEHLAEQIRAYWSKQSNNANYSLN